MTPCHHRQVHSDPHRSLALCEGRKGPEAARTLPVIHGFPPFKPNLELSGARGPLPGAHCGLESLRHLGGLVGTLMQKTANETKRKKKEERKKTKRKEGRLTQSSRLPHTHTAAPAKRLPAPVSPEAVKCPTSSIVAAAQGGKAGLMLAGDGASRTVRFQLMTNEQRSLRV